MARGTLARLPSGFHCFFRGATSGTFFLDQQSVDSLLIRLRSFLETLLEISVGTPVGDVFLNHLAQDTGDGHFVGPGDDCQLISQVAVEAEGRNLHVRGR